MVVLDKSQRRNRYSVADSLVRHGIRTLIDDAHRINHNKVMVIDQQTVITGSFNFTKSAELYNAENLLLLEDRGLAQRYANNWKIHARHSKPHVLNRRHRYHSP